jgi:phage/plasmid-like protein (TIGR03299 family)
VFDQFAKITRGRISRNPELFHAPPARQRLADVVKKYLLFSTGHDGHTSVQIRFTPVRVVCQNTLIASLLGKDDLFKIHHVPGMRGAISDAQQAVETILEEYSQIEATYERFATQPIAEPQLASYLLAVFPDPKRRKGQTDHSYEKALQKARNTRRRASKLFENGQGNENPAVQGTLWAAYNGVVELIDHDWSYSSSWQRLASIWFGEGERTKQLAFKEAKKLLSTSA